MMTAQEYFKAMQASGLSLEEMQTNVTLAMHAKAADKKSLAVLQDLQALLSKEKLAQEIANLEGLRDIVNHIARQAS